MEPAGLEPATSCLQSAPTMSRRVAPCPAVSDIYPGTAGTARERGSAAAQPCGRSLPRRLPRSRGQSCAKHRSALPDQPRIAHRRSPCAGPRQRPTAAAGAASPLRTHNRPRVAVAASTYGCSAGTSRSTFARAVACPSRAPRGRLMPACAAGAPSLGADRSARAFPAHERPVVARAARPSVASRGWRLWRHRSSSVTTAQRLPVPPSGTLVSSFTGARLCW
jgi:hypothetical protein